MKDLFEHMNYREYLADYYAEKKARRACYSYRLFSRKAGFASPNFLKLVIEGQRNLSKDSVFKFSKALGFNKREAEYFENLVFFNQSKTLEEKNAYLSNLMRFRGRVDPAKIERSEYAYFSQWYHPVIRELIASVDFGAHRACLPVHRGKRCALLFDGRVHDRLACVPALQWGISR
ncbi:MAG: TIGR02147 family protein [Chitinivibrionales bacterium]|nr:TIGR02147 family protein [Chitinivibrionales bacterium]MBD3357731.1 TIGR02147 family protein [Chitinivibrionales bacterium]